MIQDLDEEMRGRGLDAILVVGDSTDLPNPELAYLAGVSIPRGGVYYRRAGQSPVLVVSSIDMGTAKKGRVRDIRTYSEFGYEQLAEEHGIERAYLLLLDRIIKQNGTKGRVGFYGRTDISNPLWAADQLREFGHQIVGEKVPTLIDSVRQTKDSEEIEKIKRVGRKTAKVASEIMEFLRGCKVSGGKLRSRGKVQTVGEVRTRAAQLMAEERIVSPNGMILAVGPSSADPHNAGEDRDAVRARKPIILDIFPQETGGYWFDATRSFVIGKATRKVREMFEAVLEAQQRTIDAVRDGVPARDVMTLACDVFERRGFLTVRALLKGDRRAEASGFVHSLGHGVGLTIGERPYLGLFTNDTMRAGNVFTVEPGLYEPGVGGIRIEDTVMLGKDGVRNLTPLDKELEL